MEKLFRLIAENREQFSDEFVEWFPKNTHVWKAFVQETQAIIAVGFKSYSARTIIHVLRHHSAIEEAGTAWKISNNSSPYMARLFALAYPHQANIFHYKQTPKAERDNVIHKDQLRIPA
jgi:hypothetical protein